MSINPIKAIRKYYAKKAELKQFKDSTPEEVFTYIYQVNKWGDSESVSGKGSNLARTETLRNELPSLLEKLEANSLLDIPCGDFYWMSAVELPISKYIGADIVSDLVDSNNEQYSNEQRDFQKLDLITQQLPKADVIMCRECLVHLSYENILAAINNIKLSGSRYLLTTHFPQINENKDIVTGKHRPLNLLIKPFAWPAPLMEIIEYDTGKKGVKCLSLWEVNTLP